MENLMKEDIIAALEKVETDRNESFELMENPSFSNHLFYVRYKNNRVNHEYAVHIMLNEHGDFEIYTIIRNLINGNKINRSPKTTEVTDKLLGGIISYLRESHAINIYPDYFECKRFVKFLGQSFRCAKYATEYFEKNMSFLKEF